LEEVPVHEPVIITDGGPWAMHDCVCPVCRLNKAVLELHTGIFQPCWSCQQAGWGVRWKRPSRWRRAS
jgi:hypothetical protein